MSSTTICPNTSPLSVLLWHGWQPVWSAKRSPNKMDRSPCQLENTQRFVRLLPKLRTRLLSIPLDCPVDFQFSPRGGHSAALEKPITAFKRPDG